MNTGMGRIVISLDFEMRWGLYDILGKNRDAYRKELEDVREVVPATLSMFAERGLKATWATVGALACRDWNEYFRRAPQPPKYLKKHMRLTEEYAEVDPDGELHFAPDLIEMVRNTPGQELGTHTFSHICMKEPGITGDDVAADLQAFQMLWREKYGHQAVSIAFPRNQVAFLDVVRKAGIRVWRENEDAWYYRGRTTGSVSESTVVRGLRLIDDVNPLLRRSSPMVGGATRSTMFIRFNLPQVMWELHMQRLRNEVRKLRSGEVLHIWWHPHNVGGNLKERLNRVKSVCDVLAVAVRRRGLVSACMSDLI